MHRGCTTCVTKINCYTFDSNVLRTNKRDKYNIILFRRGYTMDDFFSFFTDDSCIYSLSVWLIKISYTNAFFRRLYVHIILLASAVSRTKENSPPRTQGQCQQVSQPREICIHIRTTAHPHTRAHLTYVKTCHAQLVPNFQRTRVLTAEFAWNLLEEKKNACTRWNANAARTTSHGRSHSHIRLTPLSSLSSLNYVVNI